MTNNFWKSAACAGAICVLAYQPAGAQVWEDVPRDIFSKSTGVPNVQYSMDWARKLNTDMAGLDTVLNQAPHERTGASSMTIDLPLPDGGLAKFSIVNSPIMAPALMNKWSDIQTFRVVDTANSRNIGRLDITPLGFHAMFIHDGERVFIDPAKTKGAYYSYYESDYTVKEGGDGSNKTTCTASEHAESKFYTPYRRKGAAQTVSEKFAFGEELRRYRIAVAATGEYTQYFGGSVSDGQSAIVTAINRLNVVFESEMAVRMELVAGNDDVVYTDPGTDPFTHDDRSALLDEIDGVLDTEIGNANYDIGHVFGVFGGGIARLGAVCGIGKARGVSGTSRPDTSSFIRLLAHEVGHQFNAPHSFNGSTGSCESSRSPSGAVEPHSGSTIMSYSGICGSENLSGGKDTFFHNSSLTIMNDFVENPSRGGRCSILNSNSNNAPVVQAGPDGVIPASTPFTLTGQSTDADGDTLLHIWEQLDVGPANQGSGDFDDDGQRALFRSFQPTTTMSRTFPQLARVLAGDRVMGEVLPTQDRDLTFRMTSRDGIGGVADDERLLQVVAGAGPFTIETPAGQTLAGGTTQSVSWDVANTNGGPVNCIDVSLSLSTDGGASFSTELVASTPNDGVADVDVPNIATTAARLKASCTTQPFFAINDANFTISRSASVNNAPNAVNDTASVEEDSRRVSINVLANDTDPEGDTLTLASVGSLSAVGAVEISNGMAVYTPAPGFVGTETFDYTIDDGNNNTSSARVTVIVTPKPNTAPNVINDSVTVGQDSSATRIDVLSNDTDADGDTLTLRSLGTPNNGGTVQIDAGQITYTPTSGFSGTEIFSYTVSDGEGATATATVTVTVSPTPNTAPVVTGDSLTVDQDSGATRIDVLSNDTDADGDTLTLQSLGVPSNGGTVSIDGGQVVYTPDNGFNGTESFSYTISDGAGATATGTVTVTVSAATSPPPPPAPPAGAAMATGGGGSFGPILLLLLAIRNGIARRRRKLTSSLIY